MGGSLVKDSAIYGVGSILKRGLGFFLIPIYTRFFSVEEYGLISILNIILQLVSFIYLLGISSASLRYYFSEDADAESRKKVYGSALIMLLSFPFIVFALLLPIFYKVFTAFFPSIPFYPYVLIILCTALFTTLPQLLQGLFRAQKRARSFILFNVSLFLVQTILVILAVVLLDLSLIGLLFAQLIAYLVFWSIAFTILRRYSQFTFSWEISKKILVFGVPLIPFFVFMWINTASPRFLLEQWGSLSDVGIFTLAWQFSHILMIFGLAADNAIVPYFYENAQKPDSADILGRFSSQYLAVFSVFALFTLVISKPIVIIMADPKFHAALEYIPLLILAGWLTLVFKIFHWSLLHSKQTKKISIIMAANAVLMVLLILFFLYRTDLGIFGVIIAMILVYAFQNVVGYFVADRHLKINFRVKELGLVILLVICSAVLISAINTAQPLLSFLAQGGVLVLSSWLILKAANIKIDIRAFGL